MVARGRGEKEEEDENKATLKAATVRDDDGE